MRSWIVPAVAAVTLWGCRCDRGHAPPVPAAMIARGVRLEVVATGLREPVFLTFAPGDDSGGSSSSRRPASSASSRGRPASWCPAAPVPRPLGARLGRRRAGPARARVPSRASPRRTLVYVNFTDRDGDTRVVEFRVADRTIPTASTRRPSASSCSSSSRTRTTTAATSPSAPTASSTSGLGDGGARRRSARQRPEPDAPCSARCCASTSTRADAGTPPRSSHARPAQPVALRLRPRRPATSTSATSARTRGRRSTCVRGADARAAHELRLERRRGPALLPATTLRPRGFTRAGRRVRPRRGLLDHRRRRLPRQARCRRSTASTSTPTTARRCSAASAGTAAARPTSGTGSRVLDPDEQARPASRPSARTPTASSTCSRWTGRSTASPRRRRRADPVMR